MSFNDVFQMWQVVQLKSRTPICYDAKLPHTPLRAPKLQAFLRNPSPSFVSKSLKIVKASSRTRHAQVILHGHKLVSNIFKTVMRESARDINPLSAFLNFLPQAKLLQSTPDQDYKRLGINFSRSSPSCKLRRPNTGCNFSVIQAPIVFFLPIRRFKPLAPRQGILLLNSTLDVGPCIENVKMPEKPSLIEQCPVDVPSL
ncbi:hypothetical protein DFH09DRAFT_1071339 [Mycena vulgaris]|nr:hypothetical protein DFH09DRAFT_1071339 [Mycena vulgaris]